MVASSFGPGYDSAGSTSYNIQVNWNDDTGQSIENNVSTVTATAYLSATNGGFDGFTCYYYVEINGTKVGEATTKLWGWTGSSQRQFATGSVAVPHNADGSKDIVIKAFFDDTDNTTSYTPKDVTIARTVTLTNLVRPPKAPASGPTLGRTGTGGTISITSQAAASYAAATTATTRYDYRWNNDNGASWTTVTGTSSASFPNFTGTNPALVYYFQTRAINSEGTGPFSPSAVAYAAPSITSATSVGTTATVVLAAPASNGGSTINATTGYSIDYSTDSAFGTFLTRSNSGVGNNSITGLLPGNTYYFRAKYVNSASVTSPYSASASTFIAAYGRRYATASITAATAGATTTYTSNGHSFGVGDTVTIAGVSPSNFNTSGAVTAVTANTFTVALNTTGQTYSSGGTAVGWVRMLTGRRYAADAGSGSPGWVPITTAQKFSGSWSAFSN
jgi:hypothetical protein